MRNKLAALWANRKHKKGFTLVELVIVIAVLSIIAGIAIPTVHNVIDNANSAANDSNAQAVELALKTTASELLAGQTTLNVGGTQLSYDDATVLQALEVNGLTALPDLRGSGYEYYYYNGKIVAAKNSPSTDYKTLTNDKDSDNGGLKTPLSTIIPQT